MDSSPFSSERPPITNYSLPITGHCLLPPPSCLPSYRFFRFTALLFHCFTVLPITDHGLPISVSSDAPAELGTPNSELQTLTHAELLHRFEKTADQHEECLPLLWELPGA